MVWAVLNKDHDEALKELIKGQSSDRVVAIIGGAMLDSNLRRALELRMRQKDGKTDMNEKLFRVGGPLGNTGPKIDLGYQLRMLDKPTRNAMYGLSEIRNLFAHSISMKFDNANKKMSEFSDKLSLHELHTNYPSVNHLQDTGVPLEPVRNTREKFIVNLKLCLLMLIADYASHEPWCNTPRDPRTPMTESYGVVPPKS